MRAAFIVLLTSAIAFANPKPGDEGTAEHRKAAELVQQLGDKRFAAREAAGRQLIEMGPAAVPALVAGTKSTDAEIRSRSTALLPEAKAAEWRRRAAAYVADHGGTKKHDLPLLTEWESLFDKPSAASRKLFAEMIRTSGEFLHEASQTKSAEAVCAKRSDELYGQVRTRRGQLRAELGDIAAVLFVDTVFAPATKQANTNASTFLLLNPTVSDALAADDVGPMMRQLLVCWAVKRPISDSAAYLQFCAVAIKHPLPEATPVLERLAKDKSASLFTARLVAILALGKVGGKEAAAALTDMISDQTQIFDEVRDDVRLGDAAFASLLIASGKKLEDYDLQPFGRTYFGPGVGYDDIIVTAYKFANSAARTKAIQKWKNETAKK